MRLIDADALREHLSNRYMNEIFPDWWELPLDTREKIGLLGSTFKQAILKAPTIEAEPVVRCKDCKHRQNPKECYMCFTEVEDIEGGRMYKFTDLTRPDSFCHKGEKIDGGAEDD